MMKMKKYAKGGEMTDEERYGKIGAEIRRLDPEAYKNRPRSAEGNLKLLKELRAKAAQPRSTRSADEDDTVQARPVNIMRDAKARETTPAPVSAPAATAPKAPPVKEDRIAAQRANAARQAAKAEAEAEANPSLWRLMKRAVSAGSRGPDAELRYARGGGIESRGKTRGKMVKMASGGSVSSASKRADGCAMKGKTKGRFI
jgi:hypothetical protein